MSDRLPRKLVAIMYADVAGYSRLTGEDEDTTHRTLREYLNLLSTIIESHGGQVMHYAGDTILAKFEAVLHAVSSATEIQDQLAARNQQLPEGRKVNFRIGVNLGDVIEDRGDIYGEGVNVAARLEGLAKPGGICVSEAIRTAVGKRVSVSYEFLGEQSVKNIEEPVRAYRVHPASEQQSESGKPSRKIQEPSKPSVAVLPFDSLGSDQELAFLSDGISEDVIASLSRFHRLLVVSRNSTFTYKGKSVDVRQIAQDLDVHYVVEGSVRKAGNRIRVSVQLIDAIADRHVWTNSIDRELEHVFDVQDEVSRSIASALDPEILSAEVKRTLRTHPSDLDAWSTVVRAHWHLSRFTKEDVATARNLLLRAIENDPHNAFALSDLSFTYTLAAAFGWEDWEDSISTAERYANRAVMVDDRDAYAHMMFGALHLYRNRHEEAIRWLSRSLELNPNDPHCNAVLGRVLVFVGDGEAATEHAMKALRLSPRDSFVPLWHNVLSWAAYVCRRYEEAAEQARKSLQEIPEYQNGYFVLIAAYGQLDQRTNAKDATEALAALAPDLDFSIINKLAPFKHMGDFEHLVEGLRKAGITLSCG